jgi:hypothetical protein
VPQLLAPADGEHRCPEGSMSPEAQIGAPTRAREAREALIMVALLSGRTVAEAATDAGCSRRTAHRIIARKSFQKAFHDQKAELLGGAVAVLHQSALLFVRTLGEICRDSKARDSAKAVAADRGLSQLFKARELLDLEERVAQLERAGGDNATNR